MFRRFLILSGLWLPMATLSENDPRPLFEDAANGARPSNVRQLLPQRMPPLAHQVTLENGCFAAITIPEGHDAENYVPDWQALCAIWPELCEVSCDSERTNAAASTD
jgi:hypothetical protein